MTEAAHCERACRCRSDCEKFSSAFRLHPGFLALNAWSWTDAHLVNDRQSVCSCRRRAKQRTISVIARTRLHPPDK